MDINVKRKRRLPKIIFFTVLIIVLFLLILNGLLFSHHKQNRENKLVYNELLLNNEIPSDSVIDVFFWKQKYYIITSDEKNKVYAYDEQLQRVDETIYLSEEPFKDMVHLKRVNIGYYINTFVYQVVTEDEELMYTLYDYETLEEKVRYKVGDGIEE
jgi:uncharacterized protein YpmB